MGRAGRDALPSLIGMAAMSASRNMNWSNRAGGAAPLCAGRPMRYRPAPHGRRVHRQAVCAAVRPGRVSADHGWDHDRGGGGQRDAVILTAPGPALDALTVARTYSLACPAANPQIAGMLDAWQGREIRDRCILAIPIKKADTCCIWNSGSSRS